MNSPIKIGLIGGSGFAGAMNMADARRHEIHTPFGNASDAIFEFDVAGLSVFFLSRHGPGHLFNPSLVPYRANIFALKKLGVTHIIATGAVGSLREEFKPRDLVIPDQIIDKTRGRDATFFDDAAVHVEFAEPFDPLLRQSLLDAGASLNDSAVHSRGCYVAMNGPAFSTRAESLMHRLWGGDLIGMTAMPEAALAREAEMAYALVAIVSDYDSWRPKPAVPGKPAEASSTPVALPPTSESLLEEIIGNLTAGSERAIKLVMSAIEQLSTKQEALQSSPALSALKLAIWSEKAKISKEVVERLSPLWVKYFA